MNTKMEEFIATERGSIVVAHMRKNQWNNFYSDLLEKLEKFGKLSEGQMEAVERNMEKDNQRSAERDARIEREAAMDKTPVPEGRQEIGGEVISAKWKDTPYGQSLKMLVLDDRGFKVYGSVPSAATDEVKTGVRISFIASVERSEDDEYFGFFKRPADHKVS